MLDDLVNNVTLLVKTLSGFNQLPGNVSIATDNVCLHLCDILLPD